MITNLPDKGIFAWESNLVCENFPLPVKTIDISSVMDEEEETKTQVGTLIFKSKATLAKENKVFNQYRMHGDESDDEGIPFGLSPFHQKFLFLDENDEKVPRGPFFSVEVNGKEYELDEFKYTTGIVKVAWEDGSTEFKEMCFVPYHIYDGDSFFAEEDPEENPYESDEDGSPKWPVITLEAVENYKEAYDDVDELLRFTLDTLWGIQHAEITDDDTIILPTDRPENWPDVKEES